MPNAYSALWRKRKRPPVSLNIDEQERAFDTLYRLHAHLDAKEKRARARKKKKREGLTGK